jgi:hypothetical protein
MANHPHVLLFFCRTEAPLSVGYSPFLNFQVQDFDETLYRLVEHGARMDGAVKYNPSGKVRVMAADDLTAALDAMSRRRRRSEHRMALCLAFSKRSKLQTQNTCTAQANSKSTKIESQPK